MSLRAGYAAADITPPAGSMMACFPVRPGPDVVPRRARGAYDPLMARAMALSDGGTTVCVCSCDVSLWQRDDVQIVRDLVRSQRPDVPEANVILPATHTHSSCENTRMFGGDPDDPTMHTLRQTVAETILSALDDIYDATLWVAQVQAPYNFNRRAFAADGTMVNACLHEYEPGIGDGPVDPVMTVLRFDRSGAGAIVWVNWTAHALTLGFGNEYFTADYPGALCRYIETHGNGAQAMFTNGAAGDVHPKWAMRKDTSALEQIEPLLGQKAIEALGQARAVQVPAIRFISETLKVPNRREASVPVFIELSALHLGDDVAVGFVPGELYVQFQMTCREQLIPRVAFLTGYANGWVGYIPTSDAYALGGYGVDIKDVFPVSYGVTMVKQGDGEKLYTALMAMMNA